MLSEWTDARANEMANVFPLSRLDVEKSNDRSCRAVAHAATCRYDRARAARTTCRDVFVSHCWQLRLKCEVEEKKKRTTTRTEVEAALNLINLFSDNGRNRLQKKKRKKKLCYTAAQTFRSALSLDCLDKYVCINKCVCISQRVPALSAVICIVSAVHSYFKWSRDQRCLDSWKWEPRKSRYTYMYMHMHACAYML